MRLTTRHPVDFPEARQRRLVWVPEDEGSEA